MKRTQYFKWGLTAFLTVCAVLVFYDTFYQNGVLQRFLSKLASILAPVLYGAAIAYLLTPVMSWLEKTIRAGWKRLFPKRELKPRSGGLRLVSILLTEAVVIFLLYLLMSVLIPQLVDSVTTLINNAEAYYRKVYTWANGLLDSENEIAVWLAGLITERYTDGMAFLTDKVKSEHISTVWYIEFSNHLVADAIAEAAGAGTAMFHTCHNVSPNELAGGETYVTLMRGNLERLRAHLNER